MVYREAALDLDNLEGLVVVRDPENDYLRLPLRVPGERATLLVGWRLRVDPVDAGGGFEPIALLMARALCPSFNLTFLQEGNVTPGSGWTSRSDGASVRSLEGSGFWASARRLARKEPPLLLTSIGVPEVASRLFTPHLWHMGFQTVLLTSPESSPPHLGEHELHLFRRATLALADLSSIPGIRGLMVPGHDGDWAVISLVRKDLREELLARLAKECEQAGVGWEEVSESVFLGSLRPEGPDLCDSKS